MGSHIYCDRGLPPGGGALAEALKTNLAGLGGPRVLDLEEKSAKGHSHPHLQAAAGEIC